jgi:crossover junction endodeoxyribonuclease RuvC
MEHSTLAKKSRSIERASDRGGKVVGIDPGLSKTSKGGIGFVDGDKLIDTIDMPGLTFGNLSYPIVDGLCVYRWIKDCDPDEIVIEMVGSRPEQGVSSTFKFGAAYGSVVGVALATEYPVRLVAPQVWKRRAGLIGLPKNAALDLARKLWPDDAHLFKLKKYIGRADASLIARYG